MTLAVRLAACAVPLAVLGWSLPACSSGASDAGGGRPQRPPSPSSPSAIEHVVIVIQENHTFDTHFGSYCAAPAGSNPACNVGPSCCEAPPATEPSGSPPVVLDDDANAMSDPNHSQACELAEIDDGKMDRFVAGASQVAGAECSMPQNFAVAPASIVGPYHDLASQYAMADRYFQPVAGASSSNDLYLAVAKLVFVDNASKPDFVGKDCNLVPTVSELQGKTIADLLLAAKASVSFYAEGFGAAQAHPGVCAPADPACGLALPLYPCSFDPGDVPFLYYPQFAKSSSFMKDYGEFATDLAQGALPSVSYVKAYGFRSEHPGYKTLLSDGVTFVDTLVKSVLSSSYKDNTLVLVTWDEGGGYFDHVKPPAANPVDKAPYGTRVPLLALGRFAKESFISHVPMEHSSIVKFLEWNFLGGKTGQLGARDTNVNNIGSLLDPSQTTRPVPEQ